MRYVPGTIFVKIVGAKSKSQKVSTIPLKETHGVLLACMSLMAIGKMIIGMGFKSIRLHLGIEVLSQVTALL